MGRSKRNKQAPKVGSRTSEHRDESPFAGIVLKEKKEAPKPVAKAKKPAGSGLKPSEIVMGYDPKASFGDILRAWEGTGNPYKLPKKDAPAEKKSSPQSFGQILDKWEGRSKKAGEASPYKRVSQPYKATKSFGDILSSYEGEAPANEAPAENVLDEGISVTLEEKEIPSSATTSFFREMEEDDEIPGGVAWSVFSGAQEIERPAPVVEQAQAAPVSKEASLKPEKKATYKPSRDFASILNDYEHKAPSQVIIHKVEEPAVQEADPVQSGAQGLFKKMEADDEIPSGVSWSVFSGAREIERPVSRKAEELPASKEVPATPAAKKSSYKPGRDFAAILDDYEHKAPLAVHKIEEPATEEADPVQSGAQGLFKKMEDDDEIPGGVAWSVFGGVQEIERPTPVKEEVAPASAPVQEAPRIPHVSPKPSALFVKAAKKEVVKSFDDILKEKGDLDQVHREKTIGELRLMMPQSTLDLHGMTSVEADAAIRAFVKEALDSSLQKVAIIHGKGLHSADGTGVLRDVTIRTLDDMGCVREMVAAKPAFGGSGVLWVILKHPDVGISTEN